MNQSESCKLRCKLKVNKSENRETAKSGKSHD